MNGYGKRLWLVGALALLLGGCGGKEAQMKQDAKQYAQLKNEWQEKRREVMRGDSERDARRLLQVSEHMESLSREMESIKSQYPTAWDKRKFDGFVDEALVELQ